MLAQKVQKLSTKDQVVTGFQQRSRNYVFMENLGDKVIEEEVKKAVEKISGILEEVSKGIVGQENVARRLLMALFTKGHVLLEGLPGLAKTTAIKTIGNVCDLQFKRIQFTPDLLPADVTGIEIFNLQTGEFKVRKGPIFTNLLLADEINRSPSKVQAALLEAMEERQVTIGDDTFSLDSPFLVMATQNPVEQEGTYPLPEAQLDRFMFKVIVGYGTLENEIEIMRRVAGGAFSIIEKVADRTVITEIGSICEKIHISDEIRKYIANIVFASRFPGDYGLSQYKNLIEYGASPRASLALEKISKVEALFQGRTFVTPSDVKEIALDVLRHRIKTTYEAEASEVTSEQIIDKILSSVPVP